MLIDLEQQRLFPEGFAFCMNEIHATLESTLSTNLRVLSFQIGNWLMHVDLFEALHRSQLELFHQAINPR